MSEVSVIRCDICQRVKQETNHWFQMFVADELICVSPAARKLTVEGYDPRELIDCCGDGCVQKALQAWLDARKAETEVQK